MSTLQNELVVVNQGDNPTSSIGHIGWPPEVATFERLRGIDNTLVRDDLLLQERVAYLRGLDLSGDISRVSVRLFVDNEILAGADIEDLIETVIPLSGANIPALENTSIVYLGRNSLNRNTAKEIRAQQTDRVREIFSVRTDREDTPVNLELRNLPPGERMQEDIVDRYFQLYGVFGWTREEIVKLLSSPENIFVSGINEGGIVSSVIAEISNINLFDPQTGDSFSLQLAEITEAATLPEYRGRGYYTAVSNELLRVLARQSRVPNIVYGETNLDALGALKAANRQGRKIDPQGFNGRCLNQNVKVDNGMNGQRPVGYNYNNFLVTYISQEQLLNEWA